MAPDLHIAVLYPWSGLPATDRGAARRVMPLISLVAERSGRVTVLSPGHGPAERQGNVEFLFHHPQQREQRLLRWAFWLFDGLTYRVARGRMSARERRQWWHYVQAGLQPSLARMIRNVVRAADAILLEYPFWFRAARRAAGRRPIVLTLHDLLSEMIPQEWLRKVVQRRELEACRGSTEVVCVTESDCRRLADERISSTLITHGIDIAACHAGSAPTPSRWRELEEIRKHGGIVCFFIGSSLDPNRQAVEEIRRIARRLDREEAIFFVTAGTCSGSEKIGRNMMCAGPVSENELRYLYSQTDVVLAPIPSGTGSSTKVVEAMAWGKALLSTTAGVRGHKIEAGRDCLVCDDLAKYPTLLLDLLHHPDRIRELGRHARRFASQQDFHVAYQPYLAILDRLTAPAGDLTR